MQNKQRSATYPLLLKASGTVVIEGSEEPVWQTSCSGPNGTVWIGTLGAPLSSPYDSDLVFVNGTPYAYNGTECGPQSLGQYGYESATHTIFINLGPGMPPPDVHVRVRDYGIAVLSTDHVTIDGFTFLHSRGPGIQIQGTSAAQKLTSVAASNSVASGNSRQGIFLKYATSCTVVANTASYNGRHGIHLTQSDHCSVLRNRSYGNDWLLRPGIKGNSAGIKLGDGPSATDVTDITVDYNATFSNEDTGIDIRGGTGILLRRNVSYSNGDHGYDHNPGVSVTHLNNVSAHNAHDGISIEDGSSDVVIYNCILAHNAQDATTLATDEELADLWVGPLVTGLASNHNVMIAQSPHGAVWPGRKPRGLAYYGGVTPPYDTLLAGQGYLLASGQDGSSRNSEPLFVDEANGNFVINTVGSKALERAKTDVVNWLGIDPRGFVAHDVCDSVAPNSGAGGIDYADIGAYEFDPEPGKITDARYWGAGQTSVYLAWTATYDDSTVGCKVDSADVRYSTSPITTEQAFQAAKRSSTVLVPITPNGTNLQAFQVTGLTACTQYHFAVKVRADENGQWSDLADTVNTWTACGGGHCPNPPCEIDRPGLRAGTGREEDRDLPLRLAGVLPNPSRGSSKITWSIPQARAGEPFDLSLFDVAGRRITTLARGMAAGGMFEQEFSMQTESKSRLPNGVFFVRLRVGREVLHRTVVVSR